MSGHSHWSNIKHKKGRKDAKRGKLFSRLSRQITTVVREGGGDPEFNALLRSAVEEARDASMPKENIERAIKRATGELGQGFKEQIVEGYGPDGVAFMIFASTDNRNRTLSDLRHIFENYGGSVGGPGSSSFVFEDGTPQFEIEVTGKEAKLIKAMIAELEDHNNVTRIVNNAKFS